jgi:GGDEF domain-containing protein
VEAPGPPLEPVRDELWVRALDEEIIRSRHEGMALALLLVELEEADRMRTVESGSEVGASFGRFAQAMRTALRRRDILACETDTRAWIVARDTMRTGAQALGGRIAGAVQSAGPWRGAPLTVSVGVAVLGEDGQDRETLMGAAEQDRFAAAASGTAVLRGTGGDGEGDGPPEGWAS